MISLITGIAGFVASHLADYLLEKGETVVGTYRWTEDMARIKHIQNKIIMEPMDLLDFSSCLTVIEKHRPEYIYHLAAQSAVDDSFIYPIVTIQTNTIGTLNLLEAIRLVDYDPVIHVCSSSEVYGQIKEDEVPVKETNPFRPQNPYGVGKVGADMIAYVYFKCYGIKTIRTRMFTHTGWGRTMSSAECNFARQIALIEKGKQEPIVKVGNLNSVRTFADVDDAVRAYYILVRKCTPGEVYNIGGDRTMKIGDMLNYLLSISTVQGIKVEVAPKLLRPSDVTLQIPDSSKFKNETGWKPEIPFETTMTNVLNWWRTQV
ncbi:hypothetical protein LCGC14_1195550 [marine sediment metagenome]|uniref:NAD(P)-binding domain-containing protein n=1 Tax=marine sediment metagenome TaxID=412755 RepID=A0A0F9P0U8_9ZZZZ